MLSKAERTFFVLYVAAFLDLCGVSMITMQFTNHLRDLGASHTLIGYIGSIYGTVQFFTSPLFGGYADTHGKRNMLLVCMMMCSVGYVSLGCTVSLIVIAALRFYIGIFKHPLTLIQSALSDLTLTSQRTGEKSEETRARETQVLGYYQSANSLAFIVSPPIGGYLMQTENGYFKIALCVGLIYTLNTVIIYMFMPPDSPSSRSVKQSKSSTENMDKDSQSWWSILTLSDVDQTCLILILVSRFLGGFSGNLWRRTYSLLYKEVHHLTPPEIGWLISFNAFVQTTIGVLMKYITKLIPNSLHQFMLSCVVHAAAMVAIANISSHNLLYVAILPMSVATMISKISSQSFTYQVLGRKHTAYLLGITGSIMSVARLVTPIVAGYIMEYYSLTMTLYVASACTVVSGLVCTFVSYRTRISEGEYEKNK